MRRSCFFTIFVSLFMIGNLASAGDIPEPIRKLIDKGEYEKAMEELRNKAAEKGVTGKRNRELLFEAERLRRVRFDFTLGEEEVLRQLRIDIPDASLEDLKKWTEDGTLESRVIDGQRLYFRRAVRNLYLLNKQAASRRTSRSTERKKIPLDRYGHITDLRVHAKNALEARKESTSPLVTPQRFRVEYSISVNPGKVAAGETIRCWLPFPKEVPTQKDIRLIDSHPKGAIIAPNTCEQRTVYLEQPAALDQPTTFSITFEYTAYAFVEPVDPEKVKPYDRKGDVYRKYTGERPSQIVFTPEIKAMAAEICGEETNPYLKAKKIFFWVQDKIPWSGAIEYSTVPNLAMRALTRRTGDCGMQGLLFINLCRAAGIPARWQSGWSLRPGGQNMHDWTQFYIEPYGWLYADPSRGCMKSDDPEVRWFNFGNFDRYRLIVNSNYGMELHPPKKHFRSEPVDFQRGEVEWEYGNLYFNEWDWDFKATPIPME